MKKAIGQTVRELKREVNKKVLKVPGIEQKVLDATSNEAWGPHGSLLADIAQATRDFHECQMIMAVIWKRINDSGKNWRHVYKALIVLEYLLANGAERVIEDIREHTHLISTLSSFQYIDSSGRDQGNNIRKKSQSFVLLVNDKERIIEVRQQAAANRDKFHNNSTSGMYKLGSYSSSGTYGDRYDDDRHGSKEDDRSDYGISREKEWGYRDDDRNSRGGDYYGRDNEEHNSREGYRDDEYNGSSAKAEDHSLEGRLEREASEKNVAAPPSYEEAASQSPLQNERDGEISGASAPRGSSPVSDNPHQTYASTGSSLVRDNPMDETAAATTVTAGSQEVGTWDEFDPRGPVSAAPAVADNVEMDLFSSLSDPFSSNALALVPSSSATTTHQGFLNLGSTPSFPQPLSGSHKLNPVPLFEDPFGDSPFKAVPSPETAPFPPQMHQNLEPSELSGPNTENVSNFGFGDSFSVVPYSTSSVSDTQLVSSNSQFLPQYLSSPPQEPDILADILPPAPLSGITSQHNFSAPPSYAQSLPSFSASSGQMASQYFLAQSGQLMQQGFSAYQASQFNSRNFIAHQGNVPGGKQSDVVGSLLGEGVNAPNVCQPSNDKFETKSTVWADTLSRGLVNLNISGPKINPLADIGIDFDAINRKEKRMEKPTTVPLTSNVTMGKAMGSGSGIGRVGANALKPPSNPMMGPGVGMGMGGYGAINVPIMGMGTRQGIQMQPPSALPPGSNVAGNYNSMMGTGGYHQQPYGGGGGYR